MKSSCDVIHDASNLSKYVQQEHALGNYPSRALRDQKTKQLTAPRGPGSTVCQRLALLGLSLALWEFVNDTYSVTLAHIWHNVVVSSTLQQCHNYMPKPRERTYGTRPHPLTFHIHNHPHYTHSS